MFRDPSRDDKVLRKTAGQDAGDVGGYSTTGPYSSRQEEHRSTAFVGPSGGCAGRVEWWMRRVRTAPQPWTSLPFAKWSRYRTVSVYHVSMTGSYIIQFNTVSVNYCSRWNSR